MDAGHAQAGCVLWCERTARLLWTDIPAVTLCAYEPGSGSTRRWPMPEPVHAFALTGSDDRLLLAFASSLAFFSFSNGKVQRLQLQAPRIVDGRCDRQGRFVFGSAGDGLHRLNLDLSLERLLPGQAATVHGICFSPDGRRLYVTDTASGEIRLPTTTPAAPKSARCAASSQPAPRPASRWARPSMRRAACGAHAGTRGS